MSVVERYILNENTFHILKEEVDKGQLASLSQVLSGMVNDTGWFKAHPSLADRLVPLMKAHEASIDRSLIRKISIQFIRAHVFEKQPITPGFLGLFDPHFRHAFNLSPKSNEVIKNFISSEKLDGAFEEKTLKELLELCKELESDFFLNELFAGYCRQLPSNPSSISLLPLFDKSVHAKALSVFLQSKEINSFTDFDQTILYFPFSSLQIVTELPILGEVLKSSHVVLWVDPKTSEECVTSVFLIDDTLRKSILAIEFENIDPIKARLIPHFPSLQKLVFTGSRPDSETLELMVDQSVSLQSVSFKIWDAQRLSRPYKASPSLAKKLSRLTTDFTYSD